MPDPMEGGRRFIRERHDSLFHGVGYPVNFGYNVVTLKTGPSSYVK